MKRKIYILLTIVTLLVVFCYNLSVGESGSSVFTNAADNGNQSMYNPPFVTSPQSGGWQLQTMPSMGSRLVRDLYFTDSLTGYAVASPESYTDSAHILKTTNGGNNWIIKYTKEGKLNRVIFLNSQIGFAGGDFLLKTTNSGENWMVWNWSFSRAVDDMQLFGEDTIWYAYSDPTSGGLFRTTNGGLNWEKRDSGIPANSYPDRIYFYNSRIGFAYQSANPNTYKTTNGGVNWFIAYSGGFNRLHFRDSLNGFMSYIGFYRTTNGGINWSKDSLPKVIGNTYTLPQFATNFTAINFDTLFICGGAVYFYSSGVYRTLIYKTTNGGLNWGYQIPDTSYKFIEARNIFSYKNKVWITETSNNRMLYSSTGGDSTIYVGVNQIENEVPKDFELFQNYPNPFNATTKIRFDVSSSPLVPLQRGIAVKLIVYDIMGQEVQTLVNERLQPGTYETTFDGSMLPSGVYFYKLIVRHGGTSTNGFTETKRMLMIK